MTVYLVDDSSFINLICKKALTGAGYSVVGEAYDGEAAVAGVLASQPDVVIMDIALPKKNGLEATGEILKALPATKVVAVSALEEDWVEKKAIEAGCVVFLQKPFSAQQLVESVAQLQATTEVRKHG